MDFPDAPHTGGAVSGFTPNMTQAQISEYDRRRGLGDMGAFNDPDLIVNKKPWLKPDGTHKSNDEADMSKTNEATEILKAMRVPERGEPFAKPELPKREGESEQERQVRSHVVDEKNNPKEYPGGRKQAIAIGISQAERKSVDDGDKDDDMDDQDLGDKLFGKSKESESRDRTRAYGRRERHIGLRQFASKVGKGVGDEPKSEKDDVNVLEQLLEHEKDEMRSEEERKPGKAYGGQMYPGSSGGMAGSAPAPAPAPSPPPATGPTGVGPSMGIGKSMEMLKALNSRSMHIPAPLGPYDPFGVMQRAVQVPTSGQMPHEGMPVTLKAQAETHDFCGTHGITYRKALGCGPCNIAKCNECEKCGSQMHKSFGGVLRCPRGH